MKENPIILTAPEYYNKSFNITLPRIYRLSQWGFRYYFTFDGQNAEGITFYPSVTTIIGNAMPTPYGLKKLMMDMGANYFEFMRQKALYGTLMHLLFADYFKSSDNAKNRYIDFDEVDSEVNDYIITNHITFDTSNWKWTLKKDLLALLEFVKDHNVEPIGTEIIGTYDNNDYRFAGAIDLICEMDIEEKGYFGEVYKSGPQKGLPKETKESRRVRAIVDFKSGKNGFFEEYEIQLAMYKLMAEQSLNLPIEKVFNLAPKNWADFPTYTLKDQTNSPHIPKIPYYCNAFFTDWEEPKEIEIIAGQTTGKDIMFLPSYKKISAKEYCFNKINHLSQLEKAS